MKLTTLTIRGQSINVEVSPDSGKFFANVGTGAQIDASSLAELEQKLNRATARKGLKLSIPFHRYRAPGDYFDRGKERVMAGVITGLHASNGNILVKWDGAKTAEQESGYGGRSFLKLTPAEVSEYSAITAAEKKATDVRQAFEEAHQFDPKKAVAKALADAGIEDPDAVS